MERYYNPRRIFTGPIIPDCLLSDPMLTAAAKLVFAKLVDHAGPEGEVYPAQQRLADQLGMSKKTVQRAICDLCERGLIEIEKPTGHDVWAHKTDRYRFLLEWLSRQVKTTPREESKRLLERGVKTTPRYSIQCNGTNSPTAGALAMGIDLFGNAANAKSSKAETSKQFQEVFFTLWGIKYKTPYCVAPKDAANLKRIAAQLKYDVKQFKVIVRRYLAADGFAAKQAHSVSELLRSLNEWRVTQPQSGTNDSRNDDPPAMKVVSRVVGPSVTMTQEMRDKELDDWANGIGD